MKQGDQFRNNAGSIATVTHVSGKKVSFMLKTFKDQTDVGQTTVDNFKKRFPIKVN